MTRPGDLVKKNRLGEKCRFPNDHEYRYLVLARVGVLGTGFSHESLVSHSTSSAAVCPRKSQIPTRWIDQGAHEAIEIVEVPNRYLAGITEVALKEHVSDKTNWRTMLKNEIKDEDLVEWRNKLKQFIPAEAAEYYLENNAETNLQFPVLKYPEKPKSLNLDKNPFYEGILKGIKGQYLIFDDDTVFNIRGNEGYVVSISVS